MMKSLKQVINDRFHTGSARRSATRAISGGSLPFRVTQLLYKLVWRNPYSVGEHRKELIFVHIPKCAGTSIKSALGLSFHVHNKAIWYKIYDTEKYKKYFKFTFVRNPWDRLVSAYHWVKYSDNHKETRRWVNRHLSQFDSFSGFVKALSKRDVRKKILSRIHFMPQIEWLVDENGEVDMDYVGRYENLERDFRELCNIIGSRGSLGHRRKSSRGDYREYFDCETRDIVRDIYSDDIDELGYTF